MLTKNALFTFALLAVAVGASAAGCTPEENVRPSFETDVKPIFQAHCVRCHGAGGTLNGDPTSQGMPIYQNPPALGYLDNYDDQGDCPSGTLSPCKRGAYFYATDGKLIMTGYLNGKPAPMPPPPAAPLTDWEKDTILFWLLHPKR